MRKADGARERSAPWIYGLSLIALAACSGSDQSGSPGSGSGGSATGMGGNPSGGASGVSSGNASGGSTPVNASNTGGQFHTGTGGNPGGGPGAAGGTSSLAGAAGADGLGGVSGSAGSGGAGTAAGGASGSGGAAGASGGSAGAAGATAGDATSVCKGGMVGKDSASMRPPGLTVSREYAAVKYVAPKSIEIESFKMMMQVPKTPTARQTLFVWPGLQCLGAADPARIGNGILQPVLTWGSSCAPKQPSDGYAGWWISAMYVNVSSSAAGPTGCLGGGYLAPEIGDQLFIDMSVKGTAWTQTITDLRTMMSVDLTTDLKGQVQNWATWAIEVPSGETIKPVDDVVFTQSVLTFSAPVTSCQPSQAGTADYFSAPVLSTDGLHCCFDQVILRANRM